MKVRQIMPHLDAIRYGSLETGEWEDNLVQKIAQWVKQTNDQLTEGQICDVLQPTGLWDPPEDATLYLLDGISKDYTSIHLGDWLIRNDRGYLSVMSDDRFHQNFEGVDE